MNHRIHPVETLEEVIERNHKIIKDDRVKIKVLEYYPPTSVSPYGPEVEQFNLIAKTVKEIYPTSVITPGTTEMIAQWTQRVELFYFSISLFASQH